MAECSTPYGIKGWDSRNLRELHVAHQCAQRLTASKVGTESASRFCVAVLLLCSTPYGIKGWDRIIASTSPQPDNQCSTPYGIKGWDRAGEIQAGGRFSVLNALRHQRLGQRNGATHRNWLRGLCSTPYGIKGWDRGSRQRNPSRLHRAQRLTASKVGTEVLRFRAIPRKYVLNALRHQRLGQIIRILLASVNVHAVLNALRHQRLGQKSPAIFLHPTAECSTPYGIKGWDRPAPETLAPKELVRHYTTTSPAKATRTAKSLQNPRLTAIPSSQTLTAPTL